MFLRLCCLFYVSCFIMASNSITVEELRTTFDEKLAPLKAEIGELRLFIENANKKYDDVLKKLKEQEKENKEIIKENQFLKSTVKALDSHVRKLQVACNDLQQYSRRECLEIQGIPVTGRGYLVMLENLWVWIKEDNISVSHWLPTSSKYKGKATDPAIIVKFVRRDVKERYYKGRKHLKDCTTRNLGFPGMKHIYINESLTERNKELFNECVKFKKDLKFLYIWTSNGKIYLRKTQDSPVILVNNKDDLKKLRPNE